MIEMMIALFPSIIQVIMTLKHIGVPS